MIRAPGRRRSVACRQRSDCAARACQSTPQTTDAGRCTLGFASQSRWNLEFGERFGGRATALAGRSGHIKGTEIVLMQQSQRARRLCRTGLVVVIAPALGWLGCAKVDPRPDFEQVNQRVGHAVEPAGEVPSDDAESVRKLAEDMLAAGLTADDAVRLCLLNNPELDAAYARVGIARADLVQSGLFKNPMLAASLRLPDEGGLANVMLDVAQNITDLWQLPVRRRSSQASLDRTILSTARQISALALDTRRAYFQAVAAERLREISQENLAIANRLLDTAVARQEAGAGSAVEVNLARSEVLAMELESRSAGLEAFDARRELAMKMGLTRSPADVTLAEGLPEPASLDVEVDALIELALAHRLDLLVADREVSMALADMDLERLRVFPSVELGVSFEREARERGQDTSYLKESARASLEAQEFTLAPWGKSRRQGEMTVLGPTLSLEVPLFDQNQAQIAKAYYAWRAATGQREAMRRQAVQEVRGVHERARVALTNARFYHDQLLPLREQNLELSRDGYRAGKTPFFDVLDAQRNLLKARGEAVEAQRDAAQELTELERAAGRPLSVLLSPAMPTSPDTQAQEQEP